MDQNVAHTFTVSASLKYPPGTDEQVVEISDGWARAASFEPSREGFMLQPFPVGFNDCAVDF